MAKFLDLINKNLGTANDKYTAADVINEIWESSSEKYKRTVPKLDGNMAISHNNTIAPFLNDKDIYNEFLKGFINRIGPTIFKYLQYENPYGVFVQPSFTFGDTIQEVFFDLPERGEYAVCSIEDRFKCFKPDTTAFYHSNIRRHKYRRSVNFPETQNALLSDQAFDTAAIASVQTMGSRLELDRAMDIISMVLQLMQWRDYGLPGTPMYGRSPVTAIDTTEDDFMNAFSAAILQDSANMALADLYKYDNAISMPYANPLEDQILLISNEFLAKYNITLANLFNEKRAKWLGNMLGVKNFPKFTGDGSLNGAQPVAAIIPRQAIALVPKWEAPIIKSLDDPEDLKINYWLHDHYNIYGSMIDNTHIYVTLPDNPTGSIHRINTETKDIQIGVPATGKVIVTDTEGE